MVIFLVFVFLVGLTFLNPSKLTIIQSKSLGDWLLDGIGLSFQGILIPILQLSLVYQVYCYLLPAQEQTLSLHPVAAFMISFIGIDYLYYWNHRLLHSRFLWPLHQVHHTVTEMHVLGTSRNTLWTSFLIIYLWVHGLFIYLLSDPSAYLIGVSLTAALDLWRHSEIEPMAESKVLRFFGFWLIFPHDHAWHHASSSIPKNYGANLKLWDKLHGTEYSSDRAPESLGIKVDLNLMQKLLWPFVKIKENAL